MPPGIRLFTPEQELFVREHVKGRYHAELTALVNDCFGLELKVSQIKAYIKNHNLNTGLTGRFESGHVPFNKGKPKYWSGGEETQFPKGHKPWNYKPVGTERVNGDGYVDIKIADPNKWKGKHILIWEAAHGPIPKGHAVIFGDGDARNFDPDNLVLVSRKQLAVMNKRGLIQKNAELTRTGALIANLVMKTSGRGKRK